MAAVVDIDNRNRLLIEAHSRNQPNKNALALRKPLI